jgi:hypothetical protein
MAKLRRKKDFLTRFESEVLGMKESQLALIARIRSGKGK